MLSRVPSPSVYFPAVCVTRAVARDGAGVDTEKRRSPQDLRARPGDGVPATSRSYVSETSAPLSRHRTMPIHLPGAGVVCLSREGLEAPPNVFHRAYATRVIARLGIIGAGAIAHTSTTCDRQGRQPYKPNSARCALAKKNPYIKKAVR